jgi:hypothetical protein
VKIIINTNHIQKPRKAKELENLKVVHQFEFFMSILENVIPAFAGMTNQTDTLPI